MHILGRRIVNFAPEGAPGGGSPPAGAGAGETPPAGGAAAPAAPSRPEWLPETHWDTTANTIRPEFGAHYNEVATFHKTQTEAQAALAARKPEDIKFEIVLPETMKVPDGMQLKIDDKDPRVPILREMAIKRGWDQDTVNELVAFDAQQQIAAHTAEQTRIAAEDQKLGANGPARKQAVANFLKGMKDRGELTAEEYAEEVSLRTTGTSVTAFEKIMAKANGTVPGAGGGNDPPKPAEVPLATRWYQPQKAS